MVIRIQTLGGLRILRDDVELDRLPAQRLRTALLVYVAVERRVSRESLTALFWPESSGPNARHALRQSLYQLRSELGNDWIETLPHELAIGGSVETDVHTFVAALERDDAEAAARRYTGPFLEGVHLVDQHGWESWVEARRTHHARLFRRACREWYASRVAASDVHGAIEAAQHWVGPDPLDDEAQHALISALADAGLRADALRQYQAYARLLEADELRPLEQTVRLFDQIRAAAATAASDPASDPAPTLPGASHGSSITSNVAVGHVEPGPAPDGESDATTWSAPPLPAEVSTLRLRRPRVLTLLAGLGAVAVVLVAAAAWRLSAGVDSTAPPAADVPAVAILPFDARGGDDASFVADAVTALLNTALDGATLRTADPRAVRSLLSRSDRGSDAARGRGIAVRLGAEMYVLGDVVQTGGSLHIDAAIHDAARGTTMSRASAAGPADSVFAIVDRLAAELLAGLYPGRNVLTRAAASTTSLAAFKLLLEGDAELRMGRFERAADAYTRAVELDSAFAIAHYRRALALDWAAGLSFSADAARAAAAHSDRLSPRERALLEALLAYHEGDAAVAERLYRAIVARYPEDVEAWMQLGEVLFHLTPRYGRSLKESEEAWRRALAMEPRNEWALVHLSRVAAADGRAATIDSLLAEYSHAEIMSDRRLVQMRLLSAVAARDTHAVRELIEPVRRWEARAVWQLLAYTAAYSSDAGSAATALTWFTNEQFSPSLRADLERVTAVLEAAQGRLGAAAETLRRADRIHGRRSLPALLHEWWFATLPLPHDAATLEAALHSARHAAIAPPTGEPEGLWSINAMEAYGAAGRLDAVRAFVAGQLALRLGRPALADSMAATLDELARAGHDVTIRGFGVELRAWILRERGDAAGALRLLEGLEPDRAATSETNIVPFIALASARYLRGELLTETGRTEEALGWFSTLGVLSVPEAAYRPLGHLRQAQLHARLGNHAAALDHYARFIELWKDGDPAVQPAVARARDAARALSAR